MSWIQTRTGLKVDPFAPDSGAIVIDDIAHALGNLCRFTGHTRQFYSVAQHSVLVSWLVPPRFAMAGLLHDAAEAYFNDLAKPVKERPEMQGYRDAEAALMGKILHQFTGDSVLPDAVKEADAVMLHFEAIELMGAEWASPAIAAPANRFSPFYCLEPKVARRAFLHRFVEITRGGVS